MCLGFNASFDCLQLLAWVLHTEGDFYKSYWLLDERMYLQVTSAGTGSGYRRATLASTKRQCFKPETQMTAKGSRDLGLWLSLACTSQFSDQAPATEGVTEGWGHPSGSCQPGRTTDWMQLRCCPRSPPGRQAKVTQIHIGPGRPECVSETQHVAAEC